MLPRARRRERHGAFLAERLGDRRSLARVVAFARGWTVDLQHRFLSPTTSLSDKDRGETYQFVGRVGGLVLGSERRTFRHVQVEALVVLPTATYKMHGK